MSELTRPALNLKQAYERVKSKLTGILADIAALWPIAKNTQGNGIYNGKLTISQRGDFTSPTGVTNGVYYLDRWKTVLGVVTANVQDMGGSLRYTATSSGTGQVRPEQWIENFDYYAGKVVTISAPVTSNTSETRLVVYDGVSFVGSDSHSGGGGEELLEITATISPNASQLRAFVGLTSAGVGNVSITSGDYIEFTDVRLDLGSHRLSGDREKGEELALCRRYWYQPESLGVYARYGGGVADASNVYVIIPHSELNDRADTLTYDATLSKLALYDGSTYKAATAIIVLQTHSSVTATMVRVSATGLVSGDFYQLVNNNDATGYLGLGNEL